MLRPLLFERGGLLRLRRDSSPDFMSERSLSEDMAIIFDEFVLRRTGTET